jgi:hypothetical protein
MDGYPEGTGPVSRLRARPRWQLVLAVIFAFYLIFRAIQGIAWLIGSL